MPSRAIILAAGTSQRFGKNQDKLMQKILGMPVLYHTIVAFHEHEKIKDITLVVNKKNLTEVKKLLKKYHFPRVTKIATGGKTRQESFKNGLSQIQNPQPDDLILVHNGANPLVTFDEISKVIAAAKTTGAAAVGRPAIDTIKEIKNDHYHKTHDRKKIICMQTPQAGRYDLFIKAFKKSSTKNYTDETCLLESAGIKVKHVDADPNNFKITTHHDLERAKILMGDTPKHFLVGLGQDSHEFSTTKKGLHLAGIILKEEYKLEADSDGDVILHALTNACSQAIGKGSLGRFATPMYEKGIKNSATYLKKILSDIAKQKYHLNNVGLMIEGAHPQIDPLVPAMKKQLSLLTNLPPAKIGITATTGKKLTSFGKGEGLQCFAIVSLKKDEN
jgi:2-C-methyl-D-erythritol 4-phosphate cytidylyltransferase/2-C-methyl-D-erythritol 2,4-cyclodiphosphate synthase